MIKGTGILIPPASYLPGQLIAPAGTRIPFNMSAPPVGWTTDTAGTLSDCTSTVRAASGGTTGGSTVWSGWNFGGTANANAVTLSVANMPSHTHTVNDPSHQHVSSTGDQAVAQVGGGGDRNNQGTSRSTAGDGNGSAEATFGAGANVGVGNAGSGSSFTPTLPRPQVKYTDLIIGVKS